MPPICGYSKIREEIQSGDLCFFHGTGLGPALIRAWTDSDWSHVGIAWRVGGRVLLLESHPFAGVRAIPMSQKVPNDIYRVGAWSFPMEAKALDMLGEAYGWMDCVRAGLGLPTRKDRNYQCVEYARSVLREGGLDVSDSISTPHVMWRWASGVFKRLEE